MIKVFIIADYYVHHFHTTDPQIFYTELSRYIHTMIISQKENVYLFQCLFFEEDEYELYKKEFGKIKSPYTKPKANLKLVEKEEGEPDGEDYK